jgi:MATE family multidrug resistance protein
MQNVIEKENRWVGLREVMGMSGPIILGSLSYTIMRFVDQIVVSRLGTEALAALGSSGIWAYVLGCFIFEVIGCVSTFVSQSFGRGDTKQCSQYAWQGVYLSVFAGVLSFAFWPFAGSLFGLMGHSPEVTRLEAQFFQILLFGYPAIAWITSLASFFQSVGRPGVPVYVSIAANVINLTLNIVFVFGLLGFPKMGMAGSALGTVIAQWIQALILHAVFLNKHFNSHFQSRSTYALDVRRLVELVRVGFFSGLTILMDVGNWAIFTSFIVGHFGDVSLASHNAAIMFMHLCFMPALAMNQGICAIVGQYIGRKDYDTAVARVYTAMKITIVFMFLAGVIFGTYGKTLISIFFSADPEVIDLGHKLLLLAAFFEAFDAINIITLGALRGAGDTARVALITFVFAYLFFLPLSIFLAFGCGMKTVGAWLGATVYVVLLSGILYRRFKSGRWKEIRIFSSDAKASIQA